MSDLVVLGETMAALTADRIGPLRHARTLSLSVAGAESTVAIGVRRLGHSATWLGRLGDDELAALVRDTLRAEGVSVHATVDPTAPTGLLLKERRTADVRRVHYYRHDSAGSRLTPTDLPAGVVEQARILHTSAITCALSDSALATVRVALDRARQHGVTVSFDANHRDRLWSRAKAARTLRPLLPLTDLLFASLDEAQMLLDSDASDPAALARELLSHGPRTAVVTLGADGAWSAGPAGVHHVRAVAVSEVDPVGAGDSFVAGYLAGLLSGADQPTCLSHAARVAAFSVACQGDWEGLPTAAEHSLLPGAAGEVRR
ncbi:sugar kinase [Streptomyces sp. NPDC051976]|uniref:sugar kinase n=1 Tax=Streptomyces sp. NPDC051976 TaxID=3154947 RepID=UPI003444D29D